MDRKLQFQNLIECSSLDKKIHGHLLAIEEENKRIEFLTKRQAEKSDRLNQIKSELSDTKQQYAAIEKDLQQKYQNRVRSDEHLNLAATQKQADSLAKEIETLGLSIEKLEEQSFELMEKLEELEAETQEIETFLSGMLQTLQEAKTEVNEHNSKEEIEVNKYQSRIDTLLNACDESFKVAYLKTNEKYRFKAPLTFIKNKNCRECGFMIDEAARDNVDRNFMLEFCSGCSRIICPISATTAS